MFNRFILLILLLLPLHVSAQADDCGGLSPNDCDLLLDAQAQNQALESATFSITVETIFESAALDERVALRLAADGAYTFAPPDFATSLTLSRFLNDYIGGINSDVSLVLAFDDLLYSTQARLVDGVGYLNFDKLPDLVPEGGWYGVNVIEAIIRSLEAAGGAAILQIPIPRDFLDTETTGTFLSVSTAQRLADETRDGQQMAVIALDVNYAEYFSDPLLRTQFEVALRQSLQLQTGGFFTDEELDEAVQGYLALIEALDIRITRVIGLEDGYVHDLTFTLNIPPANSDYDPFEPDPFGINLLQALDIQFTVAATVGDFNIAPQASAPPEADILPLERLLPDLIPGSAV